MNKRCADALFGMLGALLLLGWLSRASYLHYALWDDIEMARVSMGFWGGEPAQWCAFLHPLFAWTLWALTRLFPSEAWYGWLQLLLLWFSQAVVLASGPALARRAGRPAWLGALAAMLWMSAFTVEACTTVTYTTTAAALGAAAVWSLCTSDGKRGGMVVSIAALLLCLMCRYEAFLIAACFWALALLARPRAAARPALTALIAAALLIGWQLAAPAWQGEAGTMAWVNARRALMDFANPASLTESQLAVAGWTVEDQQLFVQMCALSDRVTADAMLTLSRADSPALGERLASALLLLQKRLWLTPTLKARALCCFGLLALAALRAALAPRDGSLLRALLVPLSGLLVCGGALFALAALNRLPARVVMTVIGPASALGLAFSPRFLSEASPIKETTPSPFSLGHKSRRPLVGSEATSRLLRALPVLVLAACCVVAAGRGAQVSYQMYHNPQANAPTREASVEAEYVNAHEEWFFVEDSSMPLPKGLFPKAERTRNLVLWGNWNARSASNRSAAARYGFDLDHLTASDLLREDVRFLTANDAPCDALMDWLRADASSNARAELVEDAGAFRVYRFLSE